MAEVASAFVSIVPSARGFKGSLNSQIGRDIDSSGKTAGSRFGGAMKAGLIGVAAGFGVATAKLLSGSVAAASDAQQSIGATQTVFGKYAKDVIKNSNKAATAIGLSANEYRELSNVSGALLAGSGTPLTKLAGLTDNLNKRAADMAATFGGTTREAVESISSLLKGEADPIERYGVSIKQSDVSARLAAKGLDTLTGSALKQAEQQARLELLMQNTSKTQGAFGRESDTLANRQQVLGAQFDNIKAKIGTALLPGLTSMASFLISTVVPAVQRFIPTLQGWLSKMGAVATTLAQKLQPALREGQQVISTKLLPVVERIKQKFTEWRPTIEKIGSGIAKVLPYVVRFAGVLMGAYYNALVTAADLVIKFVGKLISFGGAVIDAGRKVADFAGKVKDKIGNVVDFFTDLPGDIKDAVGDAGTMLLETGKNIIGGLISGIRSMAGSLVSAIKSYVIDKIPGPVKKALGIASPSKVFRDIGGNITDGLTLGLRQGQKKTEAQLTKMLDALRTKLSSFRDQFASIAESVANAFTGDLFNVSAITDEAGNVTRTVGQAFIDNLLAKKGELTGLLSSFKTLVGWGIDPKFLSQLFASGQGGIITEIAGMGQAGAVSTASLFGEVTSLGAQLGSAVASNDVGPNIDKTTAEVKALRDDIKKLPKEIVKANANTRIVIEGGDAGQRAYMRTGGWR